MSKIYGKLGMNRCRRDSFPCWACPYNAQSSLSYLLPRVLNRDYPREWTRIFITCAYILLLDVYKPIKQIFIDLGARNGVCGMFQYPEYWVRVRSVRRLVALKVTPRGFSVSKGQVAYQVEECTPTTGGNWEEVVFQSS